MRNLTLPEDLKGKCETLLHLHDMTDTEWQLGKTKVRLYHLYLKEGTVVMSVTVLMV